MLSTGEVGRQTIAAAFADPLSVFAARSPGERQAGALFQTKLARVAPRSRTAGNPPRERVLAETRERPPEALEPSAEQSLIGPGAVGPALEGAPVAPIAIAALGDGVPQAQPSRPGGIIPGGGTSPPTGSSGGTTTPPVSPVPEPATWVTMILGFFAIGFTMRARRPARAPAPVGPVPTPDTSAEPAGSPS